MYLPMVQQQGVCVCVCLECEMPVKANVAER